MKAISLAMISCLQTPFQQQYLFCSAIPFFLKKKKHPLENAQWSLWVSLRSGDICCSFLVVKFHPGCFLQGSSALCVGALPDRCCHVWLAPGSLVEIWCRHLVETIVGAFCTHLSVFSQLFRGPHSSAEKLGIRITAVHETGDTPTPARNPMLPCLSAA